MAQFTLVPVEEEETGPPASAVFAVRAVREFADNLLGLPAALGRLQAQATAPSAETRRLAEQEGIRPLRFPGLLSSIPSPTTGEIAAGIRALPGLVTGDTGAFSRELEQQTTAEQAFRQTHPTAAGFGELTGDIAGLIALRRPAARGIRSAEEALTKTQVTLPSLRPGSRILIESALNSPKARSLARGAGRSVETGADAAILSVLQGNDPREIAGYAAGSQMAGSAILGGTKSLFTGGPLKAGAKLTLAAGATMGIIQVMKSATPGGRDRILESIETGFDKVKWGLFLGLATGVAGAGRLRSGEITKLWPHMADAISTMPRASIIAKANEWLKADEEEKQKVERVLQLRAQNPDIFGEKASEKIKKALERPKTSLVKTINELSEDEEFREKLEPQEPSFRLVPVD